MDYFERREAQREAGCRRGQCPKCYGNWRMMTEAEMKRNSGCLPGIKYRVCDGCGHTEPTKRR
jgi:hypothetical protein